MKDITASRRLVLHAGALSLAGLLGALVLAPLPARAQAAPGQRISDEQALVDKARITAESMINDPSIAPLKTWLGRAKGVIIIPSFLKAGFVLGGGGGSAVVLSRDESGIWSPPAFYTLSEASIGLQLGVQDAEVILAVMTDAGMISLIEHELKLGVDVSMAVGPIGAGVQGNTTTAAGRDIYAFSRTGGVYGGATIQGGWLKPRQEWNEQYYGAGANPQAILIDKRFTNSGADGLRTALSLALR
jgi:lipid-binding SYLF domain-containing protein